MDPKEIIEETGKMADNLTTSQEEYNEQISQRHKTDMISDSWLSKNIRPIVMIWLLCLFTWSFSYSQITGKTPDITFVNLLGSLLTTAIMFYFGSRAAEKISKIVVQRNAKITGMIAKKENKAKLFDIFKKYK